MQIVLKVYLCHYLQYPFRFQLFDASCTYWWNNLFHGMDWWFRYPLPFETWSSKMYMVVPERSDNETSSAHSYSYLRTRLSLEPIALPTLGNPKNLPYTTPSQLSIGKNHKLSQWKMTQQFSWRLHPQRNVSSLSRVKDGFMLLDCSLPTITTYYLQQ